MLIPPSPSQAPGCNKAMRNQNCTLSSPIPSPPDKSLWASGFFFLLVGFILVLKVLLIYACTHGCMHLCMLACVGGCLYTRVETRGGYQGSSVTLHCSFKTESLPQPGPCIFVAWLAASKPQWSSELGLQVCVGNLTCFGCGDLNSGP